MGECGAISFRWQHWSRIKSYIIFDQEKSFQIDQNNLAYHPGPVSPPGGDGSSLVPRTAYAQGGPLNLMFVTAESPEQFEYFMKKHLNLQK